MLCATLKKANWKIKNYPILNSIASFISLISVFIFFNTVIGIAQILLLSVFFFLITNSESKLFGLLALRGSKRLGHISYSLYLTHMIVLYLLFNTPFIKNIAEKSDIQFWLLAFPGVVIVLSISFLSYYYIEKGGVELGKKFINKLVTGKRRDALQEKFAERVQA
jgi:peptidoglycan/LPS O-acetylase OafA/YrhL